MPHEGWPVRVLGTLLAFLGLCHAGAGAQTLTTLGSPGEDRIRYEALLGEGVSGAFLFRTPSTLSRWVDGETLLGNPFGLGGLRVALILPELRAIRNSDLPFSLNDGPLWAGRGMNLSVMAGTRLEWGPLSVILAPQFLANENRSYQVISSDREGFSPFSSPFHTGLRSLDLPSRFGNESFNRLDPGQSSVTLRLGKVELGGATENHWWGPGLRNALLLSSQAPGFPHLFVRSPEGLSTPLGTLRFSWILGTLTESIYFDRDPGNDQRALGALGVSFSPGPVPDLTVGLARTVVSPMEGGTDLFSHAADALIRWDRRMGWEGTPPGTDPLHSFFARWAFPESGLEFWVEWARMDPPGSLEDLLTTPNRTQGSILGLQWLRPLGDDDRFLRLQTELTTVEQTRATKADPLPMDFYSGQAAPQGHTQRGQMLGAGIGPGSSSQWFALDVMEERWNGGIFLERIRWQNDALYRQPYANQNRHDVSMRLGLRGGVRTPWGEVSMEAVGENRYNYLFQNGFANPGGFRTIDIRNYTLGLMVTPGRPR